MPELPEVEAVVRSLREEGLEGLRLSPPRILRPMVTRPQNPDEVVALTDGAKIVRVDRRAKNILLRLGNGHTIRVHLRMTGDLAIVPRPTEAKAVRAQWTLSDGRELEFTDMRALGRVHVHPDAELAALLDDLGLEPLDKSFTAEAFLAAAKTSALPAKLFLMDQTKVGGLGNIYAAEALFRSRISPLKAMKRVSAARLRRLHGVIRQVLESAVQSVYHAYRSPGGYRNHRDDFERMVYGREGEPCTVCGTKIKRITQGGRSTYFCSRCQR